MKFLLLAIFFPAFGFAGPYPILKPTTPFSGSRFYVPNDKAKHTSLLMLHGSEGGSEPFIDMEANVLAMQGYSVLVYCYFDCNRFLTGPKQSLKDVEATKTLDAVKWLRTQANSNGKVFVYGLSRGAELAMIVGSLDMNKDNRPDGLIAHSPSDVFNGPWNWSWQDQACWLCKEGVGKCPAKSPNSSFQWNPGCGADDPAKIDMSKSAWLVSGAQILFNKRIEVEKYDGPILITVGEKDEVWPVDQTRRLEKTLKAAGRSPEIHYFPNAGHAFRGEDEIHRRVLVLDFIQRHQ